MLLSIVIPAFNAELYIDRCMASVYRYSSSFDLFEVIVIDDGSKDRTFEILQSYCDKYANISLIGKENEGVSVARNLGIKAAKGDYVLFLDVDDELIDGSLPKLFTYLSEHEPIDMVVTRQIRNNGTKEWITDEPSLEEHKIYTGIEAFQHHYVRTNAGGGICRRTFLLEHNLFFPAGVRNAEDTIFFGQLQVYAQSIVYYNLALYLIHEIEGSASHGLDYTKLAKSHVITMRSVAEIKSSLEGTREQKAIFDYVVYQLLSNTIQIFAASKELTYRQFKKDVDCHHLLPVDVRYMSKMKKNARLMNISVAIFYLLACVKRRLKVKPFPKIILI